jgi:hypothetical protein
MCKFPLLSRIRYKRAYLPSPGLLGQRVKEIALSDTIVSANGNRITGLTTTILEPLERAGLKANHFSWK